MRTYFFVFAFIFPIIFSSVEAGPSTVGLRNPHACGLYLSSLVEDSEGTYRASLQPEEIEAYLRSEQARADLKPVLVFKDKKTKKVIHDPLVLERALEKDEAIPVVNTKTINIVGAPLTGKEQRHLRRLVRALVHEQLADLEVRIRILGRPTQAGLYAETKEGWIKVAGTDPESIEEYFNNLDSEAEIQSYRLQGLELRERFPILGKTLDFINPFSRRRPKETIASVRQHIEEAHSSTSDLKLGREKPLTYMFHRFVYFFPLPQDYQKFTKEEISAGKTKLAINTPISVLSLSLTTPAAVVIPVSLVNFSQSALTAAYSVVLANWFSRSDRNAHVERLGKNAFLSTMFTIPLYWAGRGSWEGFSAIASLSGWTNFISKKWSTVGFNIFWRFFVSNGTYKWEQAEKERADGLKREDFASDEEFLRAKKEIKDYARATRSRIETIASTIGTVGYLLAAVMPTNFVPESWGLDYFQYGWGHVIMTGLGMAGAVVYFNPNVIDRVHAPQALEQLHEKITRLASSVRASNLIQYAERTMTASYSRRSEREAQEGHEFLRDRDIREFFELDDSLNEMIIENPKLVELIHSNSEVHRLVRRHPKYISMLPE